MSEGLLERGGLGYKSNKIKKGLNGLRIFLFSLKKVHTSGTFSKTSLKKWSIYYGCKIFVSGLYYYEEVH